MKVISAEEAAKLIPNGSGVAVSGSSAVCLVPDAIYKAIEDRFLQTGEPNSLTLLHPQGQGNKNDSGLSRFAHRGLCKRVVGGHWGMSPKDALKWIDDNMIPYYPLGVYKDRSKEEKA